MARARNLKPGFFRDAALVELPIETRLLFPGLWTLADRRGKLEDKPKQIKMELYPADNFDVDSMLNQLHDAKLIIRYVVDGERYIKVVNFEKHQNPHRDERESVIPEPCIHVESTVQAPCEHGANRADSLNLIPDSLNLTSDSLIPDSKPTKVKNLPPAKAIGEKKSGETELQALCKTVWQSYGTAYQDRYGVPPVRNAKINANVKGFCQRIPAHDAPHIAGWYVSHNAQKYVAGGHVFGLLMMDAEKLRTEWATNSRITNTSARQADRSQATGDVFRELIAEAEERERHGTIEKAA